MVDGPKNVHFVRFADVATGNVFIDDTNGFVHALVVCCGPVTTFSGSEFLFCIAFGTEFLAVGCLVLNSIGTLLVVVCGVDGVFVKVRYPTVAHAFVNGTGFSVALFDCRCLWCWCVRSRCFVLDFQFLWAEPAGYDMLLSALDTL